MKKMILLAILFVSQISFAQNSSEKIKAFTKSFDAETAMDYNKAIEPILTLSSEFENDYLVNLRLGWLYYLKKNYKVSLDYYNRALDNSDDSIEALLGKTYPLSATNNWSEITSVYQTILDKDPNNYTANYNLGVYYFNQKEYLRAKELFETNYENYPSEYYNTLYLGWTIYYLGSKSKANKYFTDAILLNAENSSAKEGYNLTR